MLIYRPGHLKPVRSVTHQGQRIVRRCDERRHQLQVAGIPYSQDAVEDQHDMPSLVGRVAGVNRVDVCGPGDMKYVPSG